MNCLYTSFFVRLAQAVVRTYKLTYPCHRCGLQRHDADAVHCKACDEILNLPDEGRRLTGPIFADEITHMFLRA